MAWSLLDFQPATSYISRAAPEQNIMCVSTSYTPICASKRPSPEKAYFFMMNCLLYSRMEAGFPSNDEHFDEDVNVYLAGLLTSLIYPASPRNPWRIAAATDADIFEAARAARCPSEMCLLYRSSADRILVALGIYKNARMRRPDSVPLLALSSRGWVGRGKTYYALAGSYATQASRATTAISEVLGKLSNGFERYLSVLSLMGGEHLNIFRQISEGEIFHLENSSRSFGRREELVLRYDRFLDLYSGYLRNKSPRARQALMDAVRGIREIDPSFRFDVEERERVRSL
ncbi:MAG: hypothetical protein PHD74_02050 [Candidatus Krumholzibacteria bacterium]|nr:hypothetical protein [Candidatus Krumholzibacteria bacterium]